MKAVEVLMVEDNQGDVVLVQAAMEKIGLTHNVTVISDGAEAVEYLQRRGKHANSPRPELIMLDMKLPRKNGCEVLGEIRLDPLLGKIPVVLLSSSSAELKRARSDGPAAEYCLEKPSTYQGFIEMVRTIEAFRCKVLQENTHDA